jgi:enoyl-CoA hydratase
MFSQPEVKHDLSIVDAMVKICFDSTDYQEGQRAFAEKRTPAFTGR